MPDEVPLRDYIDQRFADQKMAVDAALAAALLATTKAEDENRRWREAANEWRGAMTDRERDFLSRREFYSMAAAGIAVAGIVLAVSRAAGG